MGNKPLEDPYTEPLVVRLTRSGWVTPNGIKQTLEIRQLSRISKAYNYMREDAENVSVNEVLLWVTNLHSCPDGVYEVVMCDIKHDFETGEIDSYNYQLLPYKSLGAKFAQTVKEPCPSQKIS